MGYELYKVVRSYLVIWVVGKISKKGEGIGLMRGGIGLMGGCDSDELPSDQSVIVW